jgi:hypothetical protein
MSEERKLCNIGRADRFIALIYITLKKEENVVKGVVTDIKDLNYKNYTEATYVTDSGNEVKYVVGKEYVMTDDDWDQNPLSSSLIKETEKNQTNENEHEIVYNSRKNVLQVMSNNEMDTAIGESFQVQDKKNAIDVVQVENGRSVLT